MLLLNQIIQFKYLIILSYLFFSIYSIVPDSFDFMIKTDMGNIIYASDFIIGINDFKNFNNFNVNLIDNF